MAVRNTSVRSMTGFARAAGSHGDATWQWELRSVNGRGLDVRLRLPPGSEALEAPIREAVARRIARGNVTVSLSIERSLNESRVEVNEAVLAQYLALAERLRPSGVGAPSVDGLLALKGVLEVAEPAETEAEAEARTRAMIETLDQALDGMTRMRAAEGLRLATAIEAGLERLAMAVEEVARSPSRDIAVIRARLAEQVGRLLEASSALDPTRLHQEAALLATRADVAEELDRLRAHIAAARELMASPEPAGRKLDFLAQELNREANTICSKANALDITRVGLEMKAIIDQIREQVANLE